MSLRHAQPRVLGTVVAMLLVALSMGTSPAQAHASTGTYAVSASVVDNHGNGIESAIEAYVYDSSSDTFEYHDSSYAYDGVFSTANFSGLELEADRDYKFLVQDYEDGRSQWLGGTDESDATVYPLTADLDLGQVVFADPATVSGVVTRASDGTPVKYAELNLNGPESFTTFSKKTGAYSIQGVPPGDYELSVTDGDQLLTFDPVTVTVGADDIVRDVSMVDRPRITGTVKNSSGQPLRHVGVVAYDEWDNQVAWGTTRGNGSYRLVLEPGTYRLGFQDSLGDYVGEFFDNSPDLEGATPVTLAAAQTAAGKNVTLALDTDPATNVDLTGLVKGTDGANAEGVIAIAYPADGAREGNEAGFAFVNRAGTYRFGDLPTGDYKLFFLDTTDASDPSDAAYLPFVTVWSGGKKSAPHAQAISVVEDPAQPRRFDLTMERFGSIAGTVRARTGAPALSNTSIYGLDVDEDVNYTEADEAGRYSMLVMPGQHSVRFGGQSCDDNGDDCIDFIRQWWNNSATQAGSRKVTVASGQRVTGVDAVLTPDLEALSAPKIVGSALVGKTLTATTGEWNLMAQNTYDITWLRGSTPVGTGATHKVMAADAGRPLTIRVEAQHYDLDGLATSSAVTPKHASTTALGGSSPAKRTVQLTATVTVPGVAKPGGSVTFYRGSVAIKKNVALVKGVASAKLAGQPKGSQSYTVKYTGDSLVAPSASGAKTVVIKK